jgi:hypothetical protein
MSERKSWKMLHMLYTLKPTIEGLHWSVLCNAGVDCGPDTIDPMVHDKAVIVDKNGNYKLSTAARKIMQCCVLANRRWTGKDMRVDNPEIFVVMPFREKWSKDVFNKMIKPAIVGAKFNCVRGDELPRVGDLTQTIWSSLMEAGLVIADVSVPNPNVFYEIGLTHAIGKDTFILKQKDSTVPADFGGSHYYEYDLSDLKTGRKILQQEIKKWAAENNVEGVRNVDTI